MAWRREGDTPLPGPILSQFTDAYVRHYGEMSWYIQTYSIIPAHNISPGQYMPGTQQKRIF